MKAAISTLLTMLVLVAAATTTAAQTPVFVPGNASGCFGNPADQCVPLVAALTVSGPGWITVTYVSGTVTDAFGISTGPDGVTCNRQTAGRSACGQLPLNEANGVWFKSIPKLDALIGVFRSPIEGPKERFQRVGWHQGRDAGRHYAKWNLLYWHAKNLLGVRGWDTFPGHQ